MLRRRDRLGLQEENRREGGDHGSSGDEEEQARVQWNLTFGR
jgi:hypothetical protein